jgi:hypothetical protein
MLLQRTHLSNLVLELSIRGNVALGEEGNEQISFTNTIFHIDHVC